MKKLHLILSFVFLFSSCSLFAQLKIGFVDSDTIMDNLEVITSELEALTASDLDDATKERLGSLTDKVGEIGMALQFQDITSQHLQQASQIVEAIQGRMNKLFGALSEIGDQNDMVKAIVENYTQEEEKGEPDLTDQIHRDPSVSQADIDALFGS